MSRRLLLRIVAGEEHEAQESVATDAIGTVKPSTMTQQGHG